MRLSLVFALSLGSRPESRVLALAPRGNPARLRNQAREKAGGAKVCCGSLAAAPGEPGRIVLSLEGPALPGTAKAMRLYLKENRLTLFRKVSVLAEGRESESEVLDDEPVPEAAATASPPGAADNAGGAAEPAAPPLQQLQDRRREFKRARAAWVAVKLRAEADLERVKDAARIRYAADARQWPKVVAGCKAIDAILDHLDDELRDTLDRYAATPRRRQPELRSLAATATAVLDRYQRYVAGDALMRAIDAREFADVQVHAPVTRALAALRRALA